MAIHRRIATPGKPYPLGATWSGRGVNFALFSAHAEKVELCLFDSNGKRELERISLPINTDHVWHGFIADLQPGQLYGYRVYGPYEPEAGHRFNANKLLVDPYAKAVFGDVVWHPACYGYKIGHPKGDLSFDRRDSARYVPKSMVVKTDYPWEDDRRPERSLDHTIFYECHVKGMTALHPEVPAALRGTYAGLGTTPVLDHLRRLGVTSVELLPVFSFLDETHLNEKGQTNYWGYNPLSFFAPENRYLSQPGSDEFKAMVARFHDAGLEVILDVVYNHTCEGNHYGPTISLRGIDNKSYYHLTQSDQRYYHNHSGCGNTLNVSHPRVLQMVMDSLRYWVEEMHVDGFRFDLATALARSEVGFQQNAIFLAAARQDPVLNKVKLIAEPWDIGPQGYRTGEFPTGWSEWNDAYRNGVRAFWRGDPGTLGAMATRIAGSSDIYWRRSPMATVNFITAHDGFTLHDLVSYDHKHNDANLEENKDGTDHNLSWNCGHEGPTDNADVKALRRRQKRNMMASLLLSQGIPMILGGDELGRTQNGNNNAYCQDTPLSWVDWDMPGDPEDAAFLDYTARLIRLRQMHPALHRRHFFTGKPKPPHAVPGAPPSASGPQIKDITWLNPRGGEMNAHDWSDPLLRCFGYHMDGAEPGREDDRMIVLMNAQPEAIAFILPGPSYGREWRVVLDTAHDAQAAVDATYPRPNQWLSAGHAYPLQGRSLVLMAEKSFSRSGG
jgi:glycogen operon protein